MDQGQKEDPGGDQHPAGPGKCQQGRPAPAAPGQQETGNKGEQPGPQKKRENLTFALLPGPVPIAPHIVLDLHSMIVGCFSILIGAQGVFLSLVVRRYAAARGFLPLHDRRVAVRRFFDFLSLEVVLVVAGLLLLGGLAGLGYSVWVWWESDLGPLEYGSLVRTLMASGTAMALAVQMGFAAFLAEIIEIKVK